MKSEEQTELPLSTLHFSRNKPAPSTWRQFLERLGQSSTTALFFLASSLGKSPAFEWPLAPCWSSFCKWVRELEMTNEKENVCLALFFFDNLSSNRAKVIWSPHNAQGFQGDSWKQTCIKTTCSLRWKPCLLAVCFKSSRSSGCISLTANSGGFCLKGGCLSGWLIKQLEIFLAEFLCYVLTKPVEHCYTNRSPWEHA